MIGHALLTKCGKEAAKESSIMAEQVSKADLKGQSFRGALNLIGSDHGTSYTQCCQKAIEPSASNQCRLNLGMIPREVDEV